MKGCKICHAVTLELDPTGRCLSCAAVLRALERKVSYGKLMLLESLCEPVRAAVEVVEMPEEPDTRDDARSCVFCGKVFFSAYPRQRFCSKDCRIFQHRIEAREKARAKSGQIGKHFCAICGKELPMETHRKKKTCSEECRVRYAQQMRQEKRARERAEKESAHE